MGCCMINMAGLAAVPALLVGSARNIFSKRRSTPEEGGSEGEGGRRYKMAECRLHGQAASKSTDSANFYADTFGIFYMLMKQFRETWYRETDRYLKDLGRTRFDTDSFVSRKLRRYGEIVIKCEDFK